MDCNHCNIQKIRDYIMNNLNHFDTDSKCGWCITAFALGRLVNFDQMEKDFEEYKDKPNE